MNAKTQQQLHNLSVSIKNLYEAGKDWKTQVMKFKPVYDVSTDEDKTEIRNHVAILVGNLYKTKPTMLKTGALGFERTSSASKFLRRVLPVKRSTKNVVVKQVDRVAQRAKTLKSTYTKAELRRLITLLSA